MSEWFKEPVLKTGDPQGPWVRIPPSPPFTTESPFTNFALEKYSRGRRGAPAKGVGRETGARVQIPPSPPRRRKRYIACGDFFVKITARSFCCGFFPPRNFASQIFAGASVALQAAMRGRRVACRASPSFRRLFLDKRRGICYYKSTS